MSKRDPMQYGGGTCGLMSDEIDPKALEIANERMPFPHVRPCIGNPICLCIRANVVEFLARAVTTLLRERDEEIERLRGLLRDLLEECDERTIGSDLHSRLVAEVPREPKVDPKEAEAELRERDEKADTLLRSVEDRLFATERVLASEKLDGLYKLREREEEIERLRARVDVLTAIAQNYKEFGIQESQVADTQINRAEATEAREQKLQEALERVSDIAAQHEVEGMLRGDWWVIARIACEALKKEGSNG